MSSEKIRVPFPIKGLDTSTQLDAQPPGTTRDAQNVRGICPRTGRNRGAQRAPVEKYTTATGPGSRTQALAIVSYDQARNKYTQLNNEPNADVFPTDVINGVDWAKSPVEGALYSVVTDLHGNIYTLSADRMIYKHSADGELLDTLSIVGYTAEEVVRRIQVDPLGNVYAATSTTDNSTLYRFEPDEDLGYKTRYRWKSTDKMIDFQLKFNQIYHVSEKSSGTYKSYVAILYNLDSDLGPYTIFEKPVPDPVSGVAVGENGSIYVTCPKNPTRNTTPDSGDFGSGTVSWTPHELGYNGDPSNQEWEGYKRIHAWCDANTIEGVEGDEVTTWLDRKQAGTKHYTSNTSSTSVFEAIADDVDRSAQNLEPPFQYYNNRSYPGFRKPPTLFGGGDENQGFGGKPCLRFDNEAAFQMATTDPIYTELFWYRVGDSLTTGQGLYWPRNINGVNRALDTLPNENSKGLTPGVGGGAIEDGDVYTCPYTTFLVVRLDTSVDPAPMGLYGQEFTSTNPTSSGENYTQALKLIFNVGHDQTDTSTTEGPPWSGDHGGNLMLTDKAWSTEVPGSQSQAGVPSESTRFWGIQDGTHERLDNTISEGDEGYERTLTFPEVYKAGTSPSGEGIPSNTYIIAVHHAGAREKEKSCYRVNGAQVGKPFTFKGGFVMRDFGTSIHHASQTLGAACCSWEPWRGSEKYFDDFLLYGTGSTQTYTESHLGYHRRDEGPTADILGFSGWVAEVITVLGETGVAPNDTVPDDHIILDDGTGTGNSPSEAGATEVEKIEGYLAWKWGLEATLDLTHPFHKSSGAPPATTVTDPTGDTDPGDVYTDTQLALRSVDPILVKYNGNNGDLVWAMSASGMGRGVIADDKSQVITFGQTVEPLLEDGEINPHSLNPTTGAEEPLATMRKIVDLGETFVADDVGDRTAWTINNDTIPENGYAYPQMFLDKSGDVYVPSDPDQEKMVGGGGVYKVNVADGSVDFHIPSPVNYFMEGADQSATGVSTGVGADDILQPPWRAYGNTGSLTRQYVRKYQNIAKHPITGEMTVSAVNDAPSPYPNTTYHGDADADGNFDYILPKYRSLLYSANTEADLDSSPSHELVQHIDQFMESNTLASVSGWILNNCGSDTKARDRAFISAPDLSPPYSASGSLGGASLLSTTYGGEAKRQFDGTSVNDRIKDNTTYCFSVWIQRNPLDTHTGSARTDDYARIELKQRSATDGYRNSVLILDLNTGERSNSWFTHGGGDEGGTYGIESFTAAKELGSDETVMWDRVWVTMPYDLSWDSASDRGLVMRIYPACNAGGTVGTRKGAIHVWGPMLIEGTSPVSHNHPGWGNLNPNTEGNPAWLADLWLDGLTAAERAADGGAAVDNRYDNTDSVLDRAIEPGDELFFSFYVAKTAFNEDGSFAGPTATDPNPTSIDEDYNTGQSMWIVAELRNRDGSGLEGFTWHTKVNDGHTYVRDFDGSEGSGVWFSQSTGSPYGHNVISEDAGDYWHVGMWMKYFAENSDGKRADVFRHTVHNSGSVEGDKFTFCRHHPITGAEFFINSGVHPDAPGGLQFPTPALSPNAPNAGSCLSIAVHPKSVEVDETGLNDDSEFEEKQKSPEFVYFTQNGSEPTLYDRMIRKHRIVAATPILGENQSPRANKLISVNNGSLYNVSTPSEEGDSYTAIEGGDSVLSADAAQVQWTQHQGKLYFVDGNRVVVYDPTLGTVEDLESKESGEVPDKPRLIASWRNRLVLARTIDEPHNWHMSAVGDPENWDYFPALPVVTQAVSGNNARAGLASDLVNTLIPYNDDLMIMGGDHSIARMTGDPMAGGQIDIVSQTIGMAFGASWTMIPDGTLFFVSTEGRIFQMSPDGQIQKISNKFVEDAYLEDWNDAYFRVKLVWNNKDDGLHVLFLPSAVGGAGGDSSLAMVGLFWERVNNAWWSDTYAAEVTPYSAVIRDGDQPQDRTVLFGTSDGTVLNWAKQDVDSTTLADYNDNAIAARVFIDVSSETVAGSGPMRCTSVETVMSDYTQNAKIKLYADDNPTTLPDSMQAVEWTPPGRSGRLPLRAKGTNIGLLIYAVSSEAVFSTEAIYMTLTKTGRSRERSDPV